MGNTETHERWVYRDGSAEGENTVYLVADKPDWFGAESRFKLELVKHFTDLTAEQVSQFYKTALRFRGPEKKFIEKLEGIVTRE